MENFKEKKVGDIMIPIYEYPLISSEATLKTVLRIMNELWQAKTNKPKTGRRHVVVLEDNTPVGIFGINEMLKAIEPQFMEVTSMGMRFAVSSVPVFWDGLFTERCRELANIKIKEFATPFEHHVNANDSLLRASCYMIRYNVDSLPVKNNDRLVGIVLNEDIFKEISNLVVSIDSHSDAGDLARAN